MIIQEREIIISEQTNNKKEVLYNLRASLPCSLTTNAWGYFPHGTGIIVRVQKLELNRIKPKYEIIHSLVSLGKYYFVTMEEDYNQYKVTCQHCNVL